MKCSNCGGQISKHGEMLVCEFCGAQTFIDETKNSTQKVEVTVNVKQDANDFDIRGGVLVSYRGSKQQVILPKEIVSIGDGAFRNNVALRCLIFSGTEKSIGKNAFENCTNLTEIKNYDNVESFGEECFKFTGIEKLTVGEKVKNLERYCFSNMPNLKEVCYAPKKNLKLNHAFANCKSLNDIKTDEFYFFPSFHSSLALRNNPTNKRPTYYDAFSGTPFLTTIMGLYMNFYKKGTCVECGGKIRKGLFHAKCSNCGIDYRN